MTTLPPGSAIPPSLPPTTPLPPSTTLPPTTNPVGETTLPPVGPPPIGTPTGGNLPPTPPGAGLQSTDQFTAVSGLVGSAIGGGMGTLKSMSSLKLISQAMKGVEIPTGSTPDQTTKIGGGIGSKMKGIGLAGKGLGASAVEGAKFGAIAGGVVSALTNGYLVITGKETAPDAVGNLAADIATSTVAGAGGALTGGIATLGLSALGLGSLPVTIIAAGLGLGAAVGAQMLTKSTGLYDSIKNSVKGMMGAPATPPNPPTP